MIARNNIRARQRKSQPKRVYKCDLCDKAYLNYPYELTFVSFVGTEDKTYTSCRKCSYKEAYGTKGMIDKMKERTIEEKAN